MTDLKQNEEEHISGIYLESCPDCGRKPAILNVPGSIDLVITCCKYVFRNGPAKVFDDWNQFVRMRLGKEDKLFTEKDLQDNPSPLHRRIPFIETYSQFGV